MALASSACSRARSGAYRGDGLVVIGVHTPEFSFEHEIDRIRPAIQQREIGYACSARSCPSKGAA
jgi:hypothetical protein